ncbi:MAG: outer membrane protein assembly factor BamC [Gammaproteobacteria bacterium]|jgi:outer membrane protein assembly factor BamC
MMKFYLLLLLMALFTLSACSTTPNDKAVYAKETVDNPLRVPPDLSQPVDSDGNDEVTSYLSYQKSLDAQGKGQILRDFQGMQFVRKGSQFWLDIHDTPTDVWNSLHRFFTHLGFKIVSEQPALGLMQTNYIPNLANIPSNWFMKMLDKLSDSGMMDSYRAHIEYDPEKKITRVFISHQGLREVSDSAKSDIKVGDSKWVVRPRDPELEVEMLMHFMAFRGMKEKQAKQIVATTKPAVIQSSLKQTPQGYVLQFNDSFARTWRLTGIALDRMGMVVEDRNRSAGVYYLRLPETFKLGNETGILTSADKPSQDKYLLTLEDKGDNTLIMVKPRGKAGKDLDSVAKNILTELKNNLQ